MQQWRSTERLLREAADRIEAPERSEGLDELVGALRARADRLAADDEERVRGGGDREDIECPNCRFPYNSEEADEAYSPPVPEGEEKPEGLWIECRECGHEFEAERY